MADDPPYVPSGRKGRNSRTKKENNRYPVCSTPELANAYKALEDLMTVSKFFHDHPLPREKGMLDYYDVIKRPICLNDIRDKFTDGEYKNISQFACDVRVLLLNCYTYFGPDDIHTKKALRLEEVLERNLAVIAPELHTPNSLNLTVRKPETEVGTESITTPEEKEFHSRILQNVKGQRSRREGYRKEKLKELQVAEKQEKGQEILLWEKEKLFSSTYYEMMESMWELPVICHFITLTFEQLNIDSIPIFEIERIFLMPESSKSLSILMTSLLSTPYARMKLHLKPPMPYKIWSRKLAHKVAAWYKLYIKSNRDPQVIFEKTGIEHKFWKILGDWNPLEEYEFHELTFHQRVLLVKALCDYIFQHHRMLRDIIAEQVDDFGVCLGEDRFGNKFLYFPQFLDNGFRVLISDVPAPTSEIRDLGTDVRVYKQVLEPESWIERDLAYQAEQSAEKAKDLCAVDLKCEDGHCGSVAATPRKRGRRKSALKQNSSPKISKDSQNETIARTPKSSKTKRLRTKQTPNKNIPEEKPVVNGADENCKTSVPCPDLDHLTNSEPVSQQTPEKNAVEEKMVVGSAEENLKNVVSCSDSGQGLTNSEPVDTRQALGNSTLEEKAMVNAVDENFQSSKTPDSDHLTNSKSLSTKDRCDETAIEEKSDENIIEEKTIVNGTDNNIKSIVPCSDSEHLTNATCPSTKQIVDKDTVEEKAIVGATDENFKTVTSFSDSDHLPSASTKEMPDETVEEKPVVSCEENSTNAVPSGNSESLSTKQTPNENALEEETTVNVGEEHLKKSVCDSDHLTNSQPLESVEKCGSSVNGTEHDRGDNNGTNSSVTQTDLETGETESITLHVNSLVDSDSQCADIGNEPRNSANNINSVTESQKEGRTVDNVKCSESMKGVNKSINAIADLSESQHNEGNALYNDFKSEKEDSELNSDVKPEAQCEVKSDMKVQPLIIVKNEQEFVVKGASQTTPNKVPLEPEGEIKIVNGTSNPEPALRRPLYNPYWLEPDPNDFKLVANSVEGVRQLLKQFCDNEEDSSNVKQGKRGKNTRPYCEVRLAQKLRNLINDLEPLELKIFSGTKEAREKLHKEWLDFNNRPPDFIDPDEVEWLEEKEPMEKEPIETDPVVKEPVVSEHIETSEVQPAKVQIPQNPDDSLQESESQSAVAESNDASQGGMTLRNRRLEDVKFTEEFPDLESESSTDDSIEHDNWARARKRKRTRPPKSKSVDLPGPCEMKEYSQKNEHPQIVQEPKPKLIQNQNQTELGNLNTTNKIVVDNKVYPGKPAPLSVKKRLFQQSCAKEIGNHSENQKTPQKRLNMNVKSSVTPTKQHSNTLCNPANKIHDVISISDDSDSNEVVLIASDKSDSGSDVEFVDIVYNPKLDRKLESKEPRTKRVLPHISEQLGGKVQIKNKQSAVEKMDTSPGPVLKVQEVVSLSNVEFMNVPSIPENVDSEAENNFQETPACLNQTDVNPISQPSVNLIAKSRTISSNVIVHNQHPSLPRVPTNNVQVGMDIVLENEESINRSFNTPTKQSISEVMVQQSDNTNLISRPYQTQPNAVGNTKGHLDEESKSTINPDEEPWSFRNPGDASRHSNSPGEESSYSILPDD